jgi:L-fucose isomerase-like protein
VLLQAYPDEIGKMDFQNRRDAFCGKLGLCSVFKQMDFKYTSGLPFVMHPLSDDFDRELRDFAATCRIVKKLRHLRVGVFGARTTAFKSVRFDEIAMERRGVEVESFDLVGVLARYNKMSEDDQRVKQWMERLHEAASFEGVPDYADKALARFGATMQSYVDELNLGAISLRCWTELQDELKIAPCSLLGIFNMFGVPATCETDVSNIYTMAALAAASEGSAACLDLNNNYGDDPEKLILFHCGPVPMDMMTGRGKIEEHKMFVKNAGPNCSWGLNVGHIRPGEITFAGGRTDNGQCQFYMSTGEVTDDPIEAAFFGTPGVMRSDDLQKKMQNICYAGFRHHTTITFGNWENAMNEALVKYLGYTRIDI